MSEPFAGRAPRIRTDLPLPLLHRGKVRDVYEVDAEHLLMVASDRVSAFDVVMAEPIPRKGEVLTLVTAWWLAGLEGREPHHLVAVDPDEIAARHPELSASRGVWARRAMLVRRTEPVLVECVVRGYLAGSAWREYRETGTLAGEPLAEGLLRAGRLEAPVFSPATKAARGEHDENISFQAVVELLGAARAEELRARSLALYEHGRSVAGERGLLLADTKFEFGVAPGGQLLLIDEVLTPDSSRFWPREAYEPGRSQPSLDKQPIRDWLDGQEEWDKTAPPPSLPPAVVAAASDRYQELFRRLTGVALDDYEGPRFGAPR